MLKKAIVALGSLAIILIPLSSVARAGDCKLTRNYPFGSEINDRWIEGVHLALANISLRGEA
ncbi:hypothetical protein [Microcoleus sp. Aus8_D3]|uniref:hypothetical protein n=1 Tax=Microcoleus sp. Aus8_D3 TaxID=2818633 RepID=UPI002FD1B72E